MKQEYPSDIEFYFTTEIENNSIKFFGNEFKHITKVMRHSLGDTINATDGKGKYFETELVSINNDNVICNIRQSKEYKNVFENITFCFPRLKSNDRFEFELEKSVELGITNFIIINTERTIPKGDKIERWNKIALAAMKQSLRTYLPRIEYFKSIKKLNSFEGEKIVLDQKGSGSIMNHLSKTTNELVDKKHYFIFGPEGGLSQQEIEQVENHKLLFLTENRLRAETAVIATATAISLL